MLDSAEIEEEKVHFANVIATFQKYPQYPLAINNRRRKDLYALPLADQELLGQLGYKQKLAEVDAAIQANAEFIQQIVANPEIFGPEPNDEDGAGGHDERDEDPDAGTGAGDVPHHTQARNHTHAHSHSHAHAHSQPHIHGDPPSRKQYKPSDFDVDKLRSTIKQFVRDWSAEGKAERDACYGPMKDALLAHFSDIPPEERRNFRVLVPGAGLGRLAFDVANLGFACQGNEFSHYMLLASYFILNRTDEIGKYTIYPYVHSFSNVRDRAAMLRPISIPDILPSSLPVFSDFSLVAGDFEEIYGGCNDDQGAHSGQWDAILTCYFIDTAKNIINYLRIMHRILAPGGVWINLGPLLWHFENNSTNDTSIELTLEEVKAAARAIGFKNERTVDSTYASNAQGMLRYVYEAAFWTATKKP